MKALKKRRGTYATYIHKYKHTYIHKYTHTYIHTYIQGDGANKAMRALEKEVKQLRTENMNVRHLMVSFAVIATLCLCENMNVRHT